MPKLTIEDLKKIRENAQQATTLRSGTARAKVTVHMGTCGISAGAREVMATLLKQIDARGTADVIVAASGCAGHCSREPMATVEIRGQPLVRYADLTPQKMRRIFEGHVLNGRPVQEFALGTGPKPTG